MTELAFNPSDHGWTRRDGEGFPGLVGPFWSKPAEGDWRWGFLAEARHMNFQGAVHGGMMMTFIDQALGIAVHRMLDRQRAATIELSVQFVAAGRLGDFVEAETNLIRRTRSLVFMRGTLSAGSRQLFSAQGIWKISTA